MPTPPSRARIRSDRRRTEAARERGRARPGRLAAWRLAALGAVLACPAVACDDASETAPAPDAERTRADGDAASERADGLGDGAADRADQAGDAAPETAGGDQGAGDEAPPLFRDVTSEIGLPTLYGPSASLVDVDRDGRLDLLVGGHRELSDSRTELFLQTEEGGFEPVGLREATTGEELLDDVLSTSVADLDGDGRPDLLLGGYTETRLQVLWNEGELSFSAETLHREEEDWGRVQHVEVADLDGDGHLDLYLGVQWIRVFYEAERAEDFWGPDKLGRERLDNVLLRGRPGRSFRNDSSEFPHITEHRGRFTYVASVVPMRAFGDRDLLYLGNHLNNGDRAFRIERSEAGLAFEPLEANEGPLRQVRDTMGVDHAYRDAAGVTLLMATNFYEQVMLQIGSWGVADASSNLPDGLDAYVGWGTAFLDADNDGAQDLAIAAGTTCDERVVEFGCRGAPDGPPQRLLYLEADGNGGFANASGKAGALFEEASGDWYGLARGDVNRDGCVDLVVTPREVLTEPTDEQKAVHELFRYEGPGIRVLRNTCPEPDNHWVGVEVPDRIGTVVRVKPPEGRLRFRSITGSTGLGLRSEGRRLHFGLGDRDGPVEVTVFDPSGDIVAKAEELPVDAYHAIEPAP